MDHGKGDDKNEDQYQARHKHDELPELITIAPDTPQKRNRHGRQTACHEFILI